MQKEDIEGSLTKNNAEEQSEDTEKTKEQSIMRRTCEIMKK